MVDTRRKPFGELSTMQKLTAVIIPTVAAIWSIFGGAYSFGQALMAYNTLSSTAADVFSMAANFESTPIVDATLSAVDCAALAGTTSLPWEGLKVKDRFARSNSVITGSNEKDTIFTSAWEGASAYCMCGTTDYPSKSGAEKHICNATTYDVSKDDPRLGCLKSGSAAANSAGTTGSSTGTRHGAGKSTVNTNDGTVYSHRGLCNATSAAQGCVSIPEVKAVNLVKLPKYWFGFAVESNGTPSADVPGKYFCVRRAGKPWQEYPVVAKASDCDPATQVFCGTFCYAKKDNDGKCPATEIVLVNNADEVIVRHGNNSGGRSTTTPIVNVVLSRGRPCYGYDGGDGQGYPKQDFSAIPNLNETDNGWKVAGQCGYEATGTTEESKATGIDERYAHVASIDQWSLYSANGINSNGVTTKPGVAGTDAERTMYNPWKAVDKDKKAALAGDASKWTLATRGGIYWKPECAADAAKQPSSLTKNKDPISQLVNLHYWLVITQGFFGLFIVGIVLGTTTLYSMHSPNQDCPCVAGEGAVEMKRIGKFKTICGTTANLIKLPVLLFAVSVTGTAGAIFARFNGCAGDEISNRSFKSMSDMIIEANDADRRALYIDLATLLYTLVTSFMAWRKGCKPNYAIMREPPEGWDDDDRKDVEVP
eukprot:g522.t1